MPRITQIAYSVVFILFSALIGSCEKEPQAEIIGVEVSESSFDGRYLMDGTFTKGTRFANYVDDTERIKTVVMEGKNMWVPMKGSTLYYKIEQNGAYLSESQWECGIGVDKNAFRCMPIFGG